MSTFERYYNIGELPEITGLSRTHLYGLKSKGFLKPSTYHTGGTPMYTLSAVKNAADMQKYEIESKANKRANKKVDNVFEMPKPEKSKENIANVLNKVRQQYM